MAKDFMLGESQWNNWNGGRTNARFSTTSSLLYVGYYWTVTYRGMTMAEMVLLVSLWDKKI